LIPKNMQENLREFSKKIFSALKTAYAKVISGIKNSAYILISVIMLLSVGIIALTQEEPFMVNDFEQDNEEEPANDFSSGDESGSEIPKWVRPARWFRSNSGGMPLEEMQSRIAAMRGEYALVIDFAGSDDLPVYLRDYYDEKYFIETRTLYKDGKEERTQWIFRDENYGIRLTAVLLEASQEAAQDEDNETAAGAVGTAVDTVVIKNKDDKNTESAEENNIAGAQGDIDDENSAAEIKVKKARRNDPARGFIEIYNERYHLTAEYRYSEKDENSKIEYFYKNNKKVSAQAMLWDDDEEEYVKTHTDYYRYNRSSFLRAVERVFQKDQQIISVDSVFVDNVVMDNVMKVSFPQNILAAAKNDFFMGEKFNSYPDFLGDLFVLKDSKLIFTTDKQGRVLEQTLLGDDEEKKVIWKIVNTWSDDRIVKITKTEGDIVLVTEYVYNNNGDRVLERNIKDGVLERVVRSDGKTDIEELYLNNKVVLQAVWEDGRKISESRNVKN